MDIDLKQLEQIMLLMTKHAVDCVSIGELKVEKKLHTPKQPRKPTKKNKPINIPDEEALLYYSVKPPKGSNLNKFIAPVWNNVSKKDQV
jgi:hypothetical protein